MGEGRKYRESCFILGPHTMTTCSEDHQDLGHKKNNSLPRRVTINPIQGKWSLHYGNYPGEKIWKLISKVWTRNQMQMNTNKMELYKKKWKHVLFIILIIDLILLCFWLVRSRCFIVFHSFFFCAFAPVFDPPKVDDYSIFYLYYKKLAF